MLQRAHSSIISPQLMFDLCQVTIVVKAIVIVATHVVSDALHGTALIVDH